MKQIPFSPIYNHVVAWGIRNVVVLHHLWPYEPIPPIKNHIAARLKESPLPYDGVSWRLVGFNFHRPTRTLTLAVGKGRYSEFRYTNCDAELRKKFSNADFWFNALTLGALVITEDDKILFPRRPDGALLSPGRLDIPCGHPSEIEYPPSTEVLPRAIDYVVQKEVDCDITILGHHPLILLAEEPKHSDDLIFVMDILETAEEIQGRSKKEIRFLDCEPDAIAHFLKSEASVSRPVRLSLAYFGRLRFGEEWFLQFCLEEN